MENISRCTRCGSFLIEEQVKQHRCEMPLKGVKVLWFNWMSDGFTDAHKDYVKSAKGLDGILYTLILCNHSPSHSLESRWVTGKDRDDESPPDKATVYTHGGSPSGRRVSPPSMRVEPNGDKRAA